MSEKLDFCFLLIVLQGGVEDRLNVEESVGFSLGHGSCREGRRGWWMTERGSAASLRPRVLSPIWTDMEQLGQTPAAC